MHPTKEGLALHPPPLQMEHSTTYSYMLLKVLEFISEASPFAQYYKVYVYHVYYRID